MCTRHRKIEVLGLRVMTTVVSGKLKRRIFCGEWAASPVSSRLMHSRVLDYPLLDGASVGTPTHHGHLPFRSAS